MERRERGEQDVELTVALEMRDRAGHVLVAERQVRRINDEVRVILEAYSDEMRKSGANYQEMFRKVKSELVRKYKAVL